MEIVLSILGIFFLLRFIVHAGVIDRFIIHEKLVFVRKTVGSTLVMHTALEFGLSGRSVNGEARQGNSSLNVAFSATA